MQIIKRALQEHITQVFFKGKAIIIYGARQVGKTVLLKEIQKIYEKDSVYFNCDEPDIRNAFTNVTSTQLKALIDNKKIIFIDEAQRVKNIGLTLKLMVDNFSDIQVIATGSSSFDLSNEVVEPLTGRKYEFRLYPFSIEELHQIYSKVELNRRLERMMIFGMYPEIIQKPSEAETLIKNIARSYLYKDVLQYQYIKNPDMLEKLIQALALQIGNEVSYNELAQILGINRITVENYINILEQAFVIFRIRPYSNNPRKELAKLRKIYFYDTGVRNALINSFNPLNLRNDIGSLWENFVISERIKLNNNYGKDVESYFWRTYEQQEIDLVEVFKSIPEAYECKWTMPKKHKIPKKWSSFYPKSLFSVISKQNYLEFFMNSYDSVN